MAYTVHASLLHRPKTVGALLVGVSITFVGWMSVAVASGDSGEHTFFLRGREIPLPFRTTLEPVPPPPLTIQVPMPREAGRRRTPGRHPVATAGRAVVAALEPPTTQAPSGPPPAVPIFRDATLRRGDAVMLDRGLHLFQGAGRFPYGTHDFVRVEGGRRSNRGLGTALVEIARTYTGRN